ncbi:MAG: hypothetical protein A2231_00125 [Candidatus Firestonebacteria bacterium RIFOXYA2_FULL_40_8]|nr:MAG: hypothetical protein A2231_00125 [Candidatus Firestonebacteria bacterium RIFOXYA2_FULL_40_8]
MENFQYLKPPPRKIPLSIKLQLLLGKSASFLLFTFAVFLVPMYLFAIGSEEIFVKLGLWLFYVIFSAAMVYGIYRGVKDIALFQNGICVASTIVEKYTVHDDEYSTRVLILQYKVNGKKYSYKYSQPISLTQNTKRLEDDIEEPILCLQESPEKAVLVDSYQARIVLDEEGNMRMNKPLLGYFQVILSVISLAAIVVEVYYMFKIYNPQ